MYICAVTDDCEMVVRGGCADMVLDPLRRLRGVHVRSAATGIPAHTVQRPGHRARPHRDAQRGAGSEARRPQCHRPAGKAGPQVRSQVHERHDA